MSTGHSNLARVIEYFYEGVLVPESWADGLRLIAQTIGSQTASILVWDRINHCGRINENYGLPAAVPTEYAAYYHQFDPGQEFIGHLAVGDWYLDRRDTGAWAIDHSEYYNDFMRRHQLESSAANHLMDERGMDGFLSVQRESGAPHLTESDLSRLCGVLPHLQQALRLRMHLQTLSEQVDIAKIALDCLPLPFFVVDELGRVQVMNAQGEQFLQAHRSLRLYNSRLTLVENNHQRFTHLLKCACALHGNAVAGGMRLSESGPGNGIQLVTTPVPPQLVNRYGLSRTMALVLIYDPAAPRTSQEKLLQQLFGLSAAEERVVLLLLRGAVPEQAAVQLGVSIATVRSQLKSVFQKTGTTRQAELMRMLSALLL